MGQIDVTDVIVDPDFLDPIVVVRRTPFVDNLGKNQLKEQNFPGYGSVQPVSGKTLQRIPEAYRVANVMSFWVNKKLYADGTNRYPDILVFKNERYAIQMIFDWSAWGEGWCEGTCVREKPAQ